MDAAQTRTFTVPLCMTLVIQNTIFTVNCNGTPVDVKFRISEFRTPNLNDTKMFSFPARELSNSATYFSTFADVTSDTMARWEGIVEASIRTE